CSPLTLRVLICSTRRVCPIPLFSITLPSPPTSPPFPYTTLFRSFARPAQDTFGSRNSLYGPRYANVDFSVAKRFSITERVNTQLDRKSTRLNSSHRTISYAVFCLKKKIITTYYSIHSTSLLGMVP